MNCEFIKNNVVEYNKKLLSEDERKDFEEHLVNCESCNSVMLRHRKYFDLLKRLDPGFEPPDGLLEEFSDSMIKESKASSDSILGKKEMNSIKKALSSRKKEVVSSDTKTHFTVSKKTLASLFVFCLIIAAIYFYFNYNFSNAPWSVKTIKGNYSVDGVTSIKSDLFEGENLLTEIDSEVEIRIPKSSKVLVNENSLVSIVQARDGDNILYLKQGGIVVTSESITPSLTIKTDHSKLHDKGGKYSFSIDRLNSQFVRVINGIVVLEFNNILTPIGAGYVCEIVTGQTLGVPYREEASQLLKDELNKYLYENGGIASLQTVLFEAKEEDSITLWNLINRVDKNELVILYDRLNQIYPVPEGVTKKRVLGLSKEVLDLWWNEIEWQL